MNNGKVGRPNDKTLYIEALMSHFTHSSDDNNALKESLDKLNSKDLLLFSAYVCKSMKKPLGELLCGVPKDTAAQSRRYNHIVDVYNNMEESMNG